MDSIFLLFIKYNFIAIYYEHHILSLFFMCSEYYCTMIYNVEYHTLLSFYKVAMMDD